MGESHADRQSASVRAEAAKDSVRKFRFIGAAKGFEETLTAEVFIPQRSKFLVPAFQPCENKEIAFVVAEGGILLDANEVIAPVVRREHIDSTAQFHLEEHFGIAHRVAVLVSVVRDGDRAKAERSACADLLNIERHPRRIFDMDMEAGMKQPGLLQDKSHGTHQATSATASCASLEGWLERERRVRLGTGAGSVVDVA